MDTAIFLCKWLGAANLLVGGNNSKTADLGHISFPVVLKMDAITILPFEDRHQMAFKELNESWIKQYFKMEAEDYKALDHPYTYIINPGGAIYVAEYLSQTVGVCALMKMQHGPFDYELAKMGVKSSIRGKGIGTLLGKAVIEKARELDGKTLYLESNTVLKPAIHLYKKLGFKTIDPIESPYSRCNIQMVLEL